MNLVVSNNWLFAILRLNNLNRDRFKPFGSHRGLLG